MHLDEYCTLIRTFQKSRCASDELLLRNIATTFTGHALIWWSNNVDKISSLIRLERQLRRRFGHENEHNIVNIISNRTQRNDEPLLDYIDDMMNLMRRAPKTYTEQEQIKQITNGTLNKYQRYLTISISNELNTIQEFTDKAADYVEYLARRKIKDSCSDDDYSLEEDE